MPRNVRNFWLELEVDGKKKEIATGPRSADGGFILTILVRKDGYINPEKIYITGHEEAGRLVLSYSYSISSDTGILMESKR